MSAKITAKRRTSVQISTAVPLSKAQQGTVLKKLEQILPRCQVQAKFMIDPNLLGGMTVRIDGRLLDFSVTGALQQFAQTLTDMHLKNLKQATDIFSEKIKTFTPSPTLTDVGDVLSIFDGVARISGLSALMAGERVVFSGGAEGLALNLNPNTTDVVLFKRADVLHEGSSAFSTGQMCSVPVGLPLLGRVIDPTGAPLDNKDSFKNVERRPLFTQAPSIIDRDKVHTPVPTGIKAVDALVPIGRGQRELIIGDRQTGKTTLILDTIISQKSCNDKAQSLKDKVFCIYVAIGQKQSTVRDILSTLQRYGAIDYTIIVSATAADSAAMQYLAPYAGCAIGEYFRDNGMHALVFFDDLSKHAVAYREMALLLKRPAGREAYPGDIFYIHARLLERAAQLNAAHGSGSLTAIPVVETQEGDVSAYIPTNIISITDGQIFLESALFHQGFRPALNVGLSVSRVGSAAQGRLMKEVSASLKLDLSQYREMQVFAQLASDLDSATRHLLDRGARLMAVMKQPPHQPLTPVQEIISLFAGVNGYLDDLAIEEIPAFLSELLTVLHLHGAELNEAIAMDNPSDEITHKLDTFVKSVLASYREKPVTP